MKSFERAHHEVGVLTCALRRSLDETLALGRSIARNSPGTGRAVAIEGELTAGEKDALASCFDEIVPMRPEHFGLGWQAKNVMFDYSPFDRTLFLDSDCLVLKDLAPAFAQLRGRDVCFAAKSIPAQETGSSLFANVSLQGLLDHFRIEWWPQILGGGHFYYEKTETAHNIFERARWWANLDRLHPFGWDKSNISDELTLQFAIVEAGRERDFTISDFPLVAWNPSISGDPDVITGKIRGRDQDGRQFETDTFYVVHFGGDHSNVHYRRERYRLALLDGQTFCGRFTHVRKWFGARKLCGSGAFVAHKSERLGGRLARLLTKKISN